MLRVLRALRGEKLLSCLLLMCAAVVLISAHAPQASAPPSATLVGWATLPVDTFAPGPTTGQFAGGGQFGHALPVVDKQVVQGFSAVIAGPAPGTFYVLIDNGFGTKGNSADSLLRAYAIRPSFRTASGGDATVSAANFRTGAALPSFTAESFITLSDPDRKLGFGITADQTTYYGRPDAPAVAPVIKQGRLLTGADLDPESFRRTPDGHFWFGDEFGPFLFETDASGRVVRAAVSLSGVFAAENPLRGDRTANLGASRGFEGLAMSPTGDRLLALLEGVVTGEPAGLLRISELNVARGEYTGRTFKYRLDANGTNIGDMTVVNSHEFLVVERNGSVGDTATPPAFKKIFRIDSARPDADGAATKTEVVDLMNVADPNDLNRDGKMTFTFPFVTIEDVLMIDANTLLVINDNNYPGGGGRGQTSDATEVLLIRLNATRSVPAGSTGGTGAIVGRARMEQTAVAGVTVTARSYESGVVRTTTTSSSGAFEFRNLPQGLYRLDADAERRGGGSRLNRVSVVPGDTVTADITEWLGVMCECSYYPYKPGMPPSIDVEGRVLDEHGFGVPHAVVSFRDGDLEESDYADADGSFRIRVRPSRRLEVTAQYPGYPARTVPVTIGTKGPTQVTLTLAPGLSTLAEPIMLALSDGCHCSNSFIHRRK